MPKALIYLHEKDGFAICLRGEEDAAKIVVQSLLLNAKPHGTSTPDNPAETFAIAPGETFEVPKTLVSEIHPGSAATPEKHYRFQPGAIEFVFPASLLVTDQNLVFGRKFSVAGGFAARVTVRVTAAQVQPFVTLDVCGRFAVNDGGTVEFSTEPFCFQVNIDELPQSFPSLDLPSLNIGLPDFGFKLPKLFSRWEFPDLPGLPKIRLPKFPFRLPARRHSFGDFPLEVGWQSIQARAEDGKIIVDVRGLRVGGKAHALEGDLRVVIKDGAVVVAESFFDLYRPDANRLVRLAFDEWHFDDDCIFLKWKKGQLNEWLRLLIPDLAQKNDPETPAVAFRALRDADGLAEIRLDWEPDTPREINLPGAELKIPEKT